MISIGTEDLEGFKIAYVHLVWHGVCGFSWLLGVYPEQSPSRHSTIPLEWHITVIRINKCFHIEHSWVHNKLVNQRQT
jgi:hypothetical protein